jgi:hypothetical protein
MAGRQGIEKVRKGGQEGRVRRRYREKGRKARMGEGKERRAGRQRREKVRREG